MRKIRNDLVGVVMAAKRLFTPGEEVPEGIDIHESLVEGGPEAASASESNDDASKAPESTGATSDAGDGKEDTAEDDSEDYSDLLGGVEETKSSAKAAPKASGRKPASRKS